MHSTNEDNTEYGYGRSSSRLKSLSAMEARSGSYKPTGIVGQQRIDSDGLLPAQMISDHLSLRENSLVMRNDFFGPRPEEDVWFDSRSPAGE